MSRPASTPTAPTLSPPWVAGIILVQALWLAWFLRAPLPSVAGATVRRGDFLLAADDHLARAARNLAHPANLTQRIPIVGASLLVAGAALAAGLAIVRGLRLPIRLTGAERLALAFGLGASVLGVLTLLLGRWVGLSPAGARGALGGLIVAGFGVEIGFVWRQRRDRSGSAAGSPPRWSLGQKVGFAVVAGPFLVLMGLGALLPTIEFDALEYHLQAPKEYFLDGRVGFLPHNVYAAMPLGVEMLTTLVMEVVGDWWPGALAGQELIAWFAPATAALIAATATRIGGSSRAGWFAAVVYLTTPWVFRAGATPFVEGPLGFSHAALIWVVVRLGWFRGGNEGRDGRPMAEGLLVGLLAGGALAIKYPALISAVVPAAVAVLIAAGRSRSGRLVLGFAVGLALVAGPWLGKNVADTGNPVYPLAWSVFGGAGWDADREARWQAAHGPRPIRAGLLAGSLLDVAGRSDWQSPLYAAFVPLAWLGGRGRRAATALLGYAGYLFLTWWLLTHRLDRFWLPMLPALAVLAGLGLDAGAARSRLAAAWLGGVLALGVGVNAVFCSTELCGPTAWTGDLAAVREETARAGTPSLARLDEALPPAARPLVIGQAGTFGLRHRPSYSTVFNRDRFESIARDQPPEAIRQALIAQQITHIYVDWAEITRYRQPGNYGFTDFETPELFEGLVRAGVLGPGVRLGASQVLYPVRQDPPRSASLTLAPGVCKRMEADTTVVTGGAGFIGSHLVERLVARGERVRVVERPGAAVGHLDPRVEVVRADIRDRAATEAAVKGGRWVYHLAANPNLWARDRGEFDAVNHRGTVHVLDAALSGGAERVVHVSTESILTCAPSKGQGPIAEDVVVTLADAVGPYCRSKLQAEGEAMARARAGAPVVVANPTMPVGPGDRGVSPPTRLIRDFLAGRLPARMDCTLNLIDVRDVADGLVRAMDRGRPARRYLLGGENLTLLGLLTILSERSGVPVPRWSVPYPVGLGFAYASEFWADHVSHRPPKATVTGVRLTRRTMHFDASRSLAELGLTPRPVRESLADAAAWIASNPG